MDVSSIDNLRALLDGGAGRWLPFTLDVGAHSGFSEPIQRQFCRNTGAQDPADFFGADIRTFSLPVRFGGEDPGRWHASLPAGTAFDEWGIGHLAAGLQGTVDKTFPPLAAATCVADVEALPSPTIEERVDAAPIGDYHARGLPVLGYSGSIYEWSWWLRGMENFLMDMVDNPDLASAVIRKVEGHTTRLAMATARIGVDVLCFYDDAGMQRGMQIAPALWRRFIKPAWQRVLDTLRRAFPHAKFFLHSCGRIDAIVPDIVELGFHLLHPLQPECMDFEAIYRQYGERILLAATISSQKLFPFGAPDDVRREVRRLAGIVGPSRRAILMPSNVIQPETPWENVVAFAEEARALREAG